MRSVLAAAGDGLYARPHALAFFGVADQHQIAGLQPSLISLSAVPSIPSRTPTRSTAPSRTRSTWARDPSRRAQRIIGQHQCLLAPACLDVHRHALAEKGGRLLQVQMDIDGAARRIHARCDEAHLRRQHAVRIGVGDDPRRSPCSIGARLFSSRGRGFRCCRSGQWSAVCGPAEPGRPARRRATARCHRPREYGFVPGSHGRPPDAAGGPVPRCHLRPALRRRRARSRTTRAVSSPRGAPAPAARKPAACARTAFRGAAARGWPVPDCVVPRAGWPAPAVEWNR